MTALAPGDRPSTLGPWLVQHVVYPCVFPLFKRASGRRIMPLVREWEERERWPPERHAEDALRRIQALARHAWEHVPLYREKFAAVGAEPGDLRTWEDFARLPRLTRDDLDQRAADLVADNVPPHRRGRHRTSGSTGRATSFWIDHDRAPLIFATYHHNQRWLGFEAGRRQLIFWPDTVGPRGRKTWSKRLQWRLLNRRFITSPDLDPDTLDYLHRAFLRFRPEVFLSFPTRIAVFIRHCQRRGLELPRVRAIITTGETLFDHQRALFAEAFGAEVFNRYGSIEAGDIAHECGAHQGLHINAHRVWVEVVPEEGLEPGLGRILITDLDNRATPFLRYECGDLGRLWPAETTHACPCGRTLPRLAEISGRITDILEGPSGRIYTRLAFTSAVREIPGIHAFQVVHRRPRTLILRVQTDGNFPADGPERLAQLVTAKTHGEFEVGVEQAAELAMTASGKLRVLITED